MADYTATRTPRNAAELDSLLTSRPAAWEYLYFAGVLRLERDALDPKLHDCEMHYAGPSGERVEDQDAIGYLQRSLDDLQGRLASLQALFDPQVQERAFGAPGQAGDAARIHQLAVRWIEVYEGMLDWAARLRGVSTSSTFRPLFESLARLVDEPVHAYHDFVDAFLRRLDESLPRLVAGEAVDLQLSLTLDADKDALAAFTAELERVGEQMNGR
jgi:hypothetical protein